jgi:uncharacterized SAM-binding protein YcdF (DUF218 family)
MFFTISKIFEFFMAPTHVVLASLFLGVVLSYTRFAKWGRGLTTFSALLLAFIAVGPLADWLAAPLEARFPPPPDDMPAPAGVIVLGGSVDEDLSGKTHKLVFTESAQRLSAPIRLRRMYPKARLVFTGGTGSVLPGATTEADVVRQYWREIGVDDGDAIYEDRSRNTIENALFTRDIVKPQPGERWLLVTSATHMPRAMGLFRKAGFDVVAFPVDFVTSGQPWTLRPPHAMPSALRAVDIATHEWWGLIASRLTGKTDVLFPAP